MRSCLKCVDDTKNRTAQRNRPKSFNNGHLANAFYFLREDFGFSLCDNTLPARLFVVLLVRPSLSASDALEAISLEDTFLAICHVTRPLARVLWNTIMSSGLISCSLTVQSHCMVCDTFVYDNYYTEKRMLTFCHSFY